MAGEITPTGATPTVAEITAISSLVATLLPSILQYGIPMVEKVVAMIKHDPTIPVSALQQVIAQRLAETTQNDAQILAETK